MEHKFAAAVAAAAANRSYKFRRSLLKTIDFQTKDIFGTMNEEPTGRLDLNLLAIFDAIMIERSRAAARCTQQRQDDQCCRQKGQQRCREPESHDTLINEVFGGNNDIGHRSNAVRPPAAGQAIGRMRAIRPAWAVSGKRGPYAILAAAGGGCGRARRAVDVD